MPKKPDKHDAETPTNNGNAPVAVFRSSPIAAKVFANLTEEGKTWHSTSLHRTYTTETGEFRNTTSFGRDQLPVAMTLLRQAYEYILEREQELREEQRKQDA